MLLKDLTQSIFSGISISTQYINQNQEGYTLIDTDCIKDDTIIFENARYLSSKNFQKFYSHKKNILLEYNDFIIDKNTLNIAIFDLFDKEIKALPLENIIILKNPNAYLRQILVDEVGKAYVRSELKKALHDSNFIEKIGNIIVHDNFAKIEEIKKERLRPDRQPINALTISVRKGLMTLDKILKRIDYAEINLDTGFQRKKGLWNVELKSRFIEALIVNQPVPAFYFDATETTDEKGVWQIIDGLQRLSSIKEFVVDKSFKLEGMYYLPQYEGKTFAQLPRSAQRNIEETELITYIVEPPTPKEVKYKIFKSINTSALRLTAQEIRHALNQGTPAIYLEQVANMPVFKKTIPILTEDRVERMEDRELALRYLAFRMTHYKDIKPNSTDLLDEAMTQIYSRDKMELEGFKNELGDALLLIDYIFNTTAYTKAMIGLENTGFVNPLFEVWTYSIAKISKTQKEILEKKAKLVKESAIFLGKNAKLANSLENPYTKGNIEIRFKTIEDFIKQITK